MSRIYWLLISLFRGKDTSKNYMKQLFFYNSCVFCRRVSIISCTTSSMNFSCSTMSSRASPAFLTYGLLRSRLGIVRTSSALLSLLPQVTSRPLPVSCSCLTMISAKATFSAPAKAGPHPARRSHRRWLFFAHWCRRNHADQAPTKHRSSLMSHLPG